MSRPQRSSEDIAPLQSYANTVIAVLQSKSLSSSSGSTAKQIGLTSPHNRSVFAVTPNTSTKLIRTSYLPRPICPHRARRDRENLVHLAYAAQKPDLEMRDSARSSTESSRTAKRFRADSTRMSLKRRSNLDPSTRNTASSRIRSLAIYNNRPHDCFCFCCRENHPCCT